MSGANFILDPMRGWEHSIRMAHAHVRAAAQPEQTTTLPIDGAPRGAGRVDAPTVAEVEWLRKWALDAFPEPFDSEDRRAQRVVVRLSEAFAAGRAVTTPLPSIDRETLGRRVRQLWVDFARTQPNPKPHHLAPWEDLDEPNREVDRIIGETIASEVAEACFAAVSKAGDPVYVDPAVAEARKALRVPPAVEPVNGTVKAWTILDAKQEARDAIARAEKAEAQLAKLTSELAEARADVEGAEAGRNITHRQWTIEHNAMADANARLVAERDAATKRAEEAEQTAAALRLRVAELSAVARLRTDTADALRSRPAVPEEVRNTAIASKIAEVKAALDALMVMVEP